MPKTVRRRTQEELVMLKKYIFDECIAKRMKCKDGSKILKMHEKAFSRLKTRYKEEGMIALYGKKPGPKEGVEVYNKTPEDIEEIVKEVALARPDLGPDPLSDLLNDEHGIKIDSTTVWRILKRKKVRYTAEYKRWKKEPKLYCLDTPGEELQLDACYPWGRQRKLVSFDAIDDCSRYVFGKCYYHEDAKTAIRFVKELINKVSFPIKRIRVDNRYGKEFKDYCENILGIKVIENDPYSPEQNGKIERFHKTLKHEFFFRSCAYNENIQIINLKYKLWLYYYNYKRKHSGYKMNKLTPAQKIASTLLLSTTMNVLYYPQKVTGTLQQYIN
jgi:transposase InsO family protein